MKRILFIIAFSTCFYGLSQTPAPVVDAVRFNAKTEAQMLAFTRMTEGTACFREDTDSIWIYDGTQWNDTGSGSMTDAQVKVAYENNPDTNAFTDAEKTKLGNTVEGAHTVDTKNSQAETAANVSAEWPDLDTDGSGTKLSAGANITITGSGTIGSPYQISGSGTTNWADPVDSNITFGGDQLYNIGTASVGALGIYAATFHGSLEGSGVDVNTLNTGYVNIGGMASDLDVSGFAAGSATIFHNSTDGRTKVGIGGGATRTIAFTDELGGGSAIGTKVADYAGLAGLTGMVDGDLAIVTGEGIAGDFVYDPAQSAVDDGGTVKLGWVRQYEGPVNIEWFESDGDGTTENTAAIQAAIDVGNIHVPKGNFYFTGTLTIPANRTISGEGRESVLYPVNSTTVPISITGDNVNIRDLAIIGEATSGINISADNTVIERIHFETNGTLLNQCIRLFAANNVKVLNCTFEDVGYGIIQQTGNVSNNVLIDGCFSNNARRDFIEANCTSTAPSKNWTITNNFFQNGKNYAAAITAEAGDDYVTYRENRFIGITAVTNVIISGNTAENVAGDAAVHVEDIGSTLQIENNIFDNILGRGYIFISGPSTTLDYNETIISGNTFKRTDATTGIGNVLSLSSNRYVNEIVFSDNRVVGDVSNNLTLDISYQDNFRIHGNTFRHCTNAINALGGNDASIINNTFRDCGTALFAPTLDRTQILGNSVSDCTIGFDLHDGSTLERGARDVNISGNIFFNISGYNIVSRRDSNGFNPPERMLVSSNIFSENLGTTTFAVRIKGNAPTGSLASKDITMTNNTFMTGATYDVDGDDLNIFGNVFHVDGSNDLPSGGADGVVSNIALSGTDLNVTGSGGGFNGSVDLSSLGGGLPTGLSYHGSANKLNIWDNYNTDLMVLDFSDAENTASSFDTGLYYDSGISAFVLKHSTGNIMDMRALFTSFSQPLIVPSQTYSASGDDDRVPTRQFVREGLATRVEIHPDTGQPNPRLAIGTEAQRALATLGANDVWISTDAAPADTGTSATAVPLDGYFLGSMSSANTATVYTTDASRRKAGGYAKFLINAASEPTVDGSSTEESGATFATSTDMYLVMWYDGVAVKHFFLEK